MENKRINKEITAPEVRVIGEDNTMHGVMPLRDALRLAYNEGLDLIEISPNASPPVCKIADYGKMKYELVKKESEEKKKNKHHKPKEIKFNLNIAEHDFQVKMNHIKEFIKGGYPVKVLCQARGRMKVYSKEKLPQLSERIVSETPEFAMINGKMETRETSHDFILISKIKTQPLK